MASQIIDRRTVVIPGPMGDVTPAALQAKNDAEAAAVAAVGSASAAASSEASAADSAALAELFAAPVRTTDWNSETTAGFRWAVGSSVANAPLPGTSLVHSGIVLTGVAEGADVVWQIVHYGGASSAATWTRYLGASGVWSAWEEQGADTGWVDLSNHLLNGFEGTLQARRIGKMVDVYASVVGDIPDSSTVTDIATGIPEEFWPSTTKVGTAYRSGYNGGFVVRSTGVVGIGHHSGTTWSAAGPCSATYFVG